MNGNGRSAAASSYRWRDSDLISAITIGAKPCYMSIRRIPMKELVFPKAALVRLFGFNPNPDDQGEPHGPGGPVIRNTILDRISWVLLNPQPLPPKYAAVSRMGPVPDPWRSATIA